MIPTPSLGLSRNAAHVYTAHYPPLDPIVLPSVTTAQKIMDKPAIVPWAQGIVAEAAIDHRADIEGWIAVGGRDGAVELLRKAAVTKRDKAANVGSEVHALAENIARGQPIVIPQELAGFVAAYQRWIADFQPEFLAAEEMVANLEYGYAGTLDGLVRIAGETWLLDWKTSKGVYPETSLQLAAYGHAEFIGRPGTLTRFAIPPIDQYAVVHLTPDGYEFVPFDVTEQDFDAFLAALRLWRWRDGHATRVMGQPIGPALLRLGKEQIAV